jgi:hypothetical protein
LDLKPPPTIAPENLIAIEDRPASAIEGDAADSSRTGQGPSFRSIYMMRGFMGACGMRLVSRIHAQSEMFGSPGLVEY